VINFAQTARSYVAAVLAGAAAYTMALPAAAASPFDMLAGSWSGNGKATFDNGQSEALRCSAMYRSLGNGAQLRLAIRCASASAKVDLRATLAHAGGRVSGNWEERTYNAGGTVSGTASGSSVRMAFTGGIGGTMSLSVSRSSHQVSINAAGSSLRTVSMSLSK